jgi:uncharacterized protein
MIVVRQIEGKGRGVFARRAFREGELIERAPVIVIPASESEHIEQCVLQDYRFQWREGEGDRAIVLGYGMLYNHSYQPNARPVHRIEEREMDYIALRPIAEGEEICINYNYNGVIDDQSPVWFEVVS